jgi:hypothetical protein
MALTSTLHRVPQLRDIAEIKSNKIALCIDGANLSTTATTFDFNIDYKRLLQEFRSRGTLVRALYYTAIVEAQEYSSIRTLISWLDYDGNTVVTKATEEFIDASGSRNVKGNMCTELAVNAMELTQHIDQIVLSSGSRDFRSLVEAFYLTPPCHIWTQHLETYQWALKMSGYPGRPEVIGAWSGREAAHFCRLVLLAASWPFSVCAQQAQQTRVGWRAFAPHPFINGVRREKRQLKWIMRKFCNRLSLLADVK